MDEGPYESRQALVLDPIPLRKNRDVFTDLPPEIRNMIYSHVMEGEEKGEIRITRIRGESIISANVTSDVRNLLLVSKQISQEAASMFYGSRIFRFDDAACLCFFLGMIGFRNRASVAHIVLSNSASAEYFKSAAVLLRCLTGLRRFQVRFGRVYAQYHQRVHNMARFVKDFLSFFTAVDKTRGDKAFFDIINVCGLYACRDAPFSRLDDNNRMRMERQAAGTNTATHTALFQDSSKRN